MRRCMENWAPTYRVDCCTPVADVTSLVDIMHTHTHTRTLISVYITWLYRGNDEIHSAAVTVTLLCRGYDAYSHNAIAIALCERLTERLRRRLLLDSSVLRAIPTFTTDIDIMTEGFRWTKLPNVHWWCDGAAEYGDYTEDEFGPSSAYLRQLKLLPQQTNDIELKIMEHHKEHLYDIILCNLFYVIHSRSSKS